MIEYIEDFLGVSSGTLTSDGGIIFTLCISMVLILLFVKVLLVWFDNLFGGL